MTEKPDKPLDLVLLKVDPAAHPLYFVIAVERYDEEYGTDEHRQYLYDEHTCPTNWTDQIIAVISKGDLDPHGFATYVRSIAAPAGMDESGDIAGDCNTDWLSIFPEAAA